MSLELKSTVTIVAPFFSFSIIDKTQSVNLTSLKLGQLACAHVKLLSGVGF